MQVVRLHGPRDLRQHEEPIPVPGPGEALVRVTAVGICGSDIHWFLEGGIGESRVTQPLILGHECAGVIASGQRRGERVAVDPGIPCGACDFCQEGHPNLCANVYFAGCEADDGALREYVAWPTRCLHPLPAALSDADGAMLEPLGVALFSVDLAHLKPGMTVGVFGCGPIGLLVLQVAHVAGATRLIATDKLAHRREAARSLGATVFPASDGRESADVLAATDGRGVDVAFEVAGANEAVEAAIAAVRPGGKVILVGIPTEDQTAFNAHTARRKGLTIKLVHRMQHTYPRAIRLVEQGLVDVRSLVTHRFPLAETAQAYALAQRREGLKVMITP
jgi:L-iditol 2-dehydrogenase